MAIIGIAGTKQSGKDSTAKLITVMVMKYVGLINKYTMLDDTTIEVEYQLMNHNNGTVGFKKDILDFERRDDAFMGYMYEMVWPHVKMYHFADSLKYILANMFRVELSKLFGSNGDKDSPTHITWEKLSGILPIVPGAKTKTLSGFVTHRELMQNFADVLRHIDDRCFINYTLDEIGREQCPISIVADIRTKTELEEVKNAGGKIIYLTRRIDNDDKHHIENDLLSITKDDVDIFIDNQDMTLAEKNVAIENALKDIGFLQ